MKKTAIYLSTTLLCLTTNSCLNSEAKNISSESALTLSENQGHSISLESQISTDNTYAINWNSTLPKTEVSYNVNLNGKVIKADVTKTIVSEDGTLFEVNVPSNDFKIHPKDLSNGENIVQIIAIHNNIKLFQSNSIVIDHPKSQILASK